MNVAPVTLIHVFAVDPSDQAELAHLSTQATFPGRARLIRALAGMEPGALFVQQQI